MPIFQAILNALELYDKLHGNGTLEMSYNDTIYCNAWIAICNIINQDTNQIYNLQHTGEISIETFCLVSHATFPIL